MTAGSGLAGRVDAMVSRWLVSAPAGTRRRIVVVLGCLVAVAIIGIVDHSAGTQYSFVIFYVLPVVAGALFARSLEAHLLGFVAAVTWSFADVLVAEKMHIEALVWNVAGRTIIFSAIVFLLGALRTAVEASRTSEALSREFLATAAHQLRTPLAGLIASAEALSFVNDPSERQRLVDNLVAATNRSRRLLSSLLEMSRLDQPASTDARTLDIDEICVREVDAASIAHPSLAVDYVGPRTRVTSPAGDAFREALSNLIDNATRHATGSIRVVLEVGSSTATVTVSDDGPGLAPGSEARAFERFVSLDGMGGAGLGLPIALASMRSAGGDLRYRNATFVMTVPIVR